MTGKLNSLQALRALAAIAVVAHHTFRATTLFISPPIHSFLVPPPWLIQFGAAGVDVFFVISGFLMTYISEPYLSKLKSPTQFLAQRIIRIWPPYVVATIIACALILFDSRHLHSIPFDLHARRLASLLFIPSFNDRGLLQPIIGPGWSLNYEAMFYVCFSITLLLGRRKAFLKLATIIGIIFIVGALSPAGVIHSFLGNPIIFEFLIGAATGFFLKVSQSNLSRPWIWIIAAIVLLGVLNLSRLTVEQRLFAYGIPAAALFVGFVALDPFVKWPSFVLLLGDASYSIYLVHTLIIYKVIGAAQGMLERHGLTTISTFASSFLAIAAAVALGILFYWLIERPLLRASQAAYNRVSGLRSPPPLVSQ